MQFDQGEVTNFTILEFMKKKSKALPIFMNLIKFLER